MIECQNCKYFENCTKVGHKCTSDRIAYTIYPKDCISYTVNPKRTNFDNVTLSPKTLAKFIDGQIRYSLDLKGCLFGALCEEGVECEECITKWLKQKAKETEK